jgi:hypothetical protein
MIYVFYYSKDDDYGFSVVKCPFTAVCITLLYSIYYIAMHIFIRNSRFAELTVLGYCVFVTL